MNMKTVVTDGTKVDTSDQVLDETTDEKKQTVKYDTYDRAMKRGTKLETELQETREKLATFEKAESDKAEQLLEEQGKFKERLELEQRKREDVESKYTGLSELHFGTIKEAALRREIPKLVDDGDIDAIVRASAGKILLDDDGFPIKESVEEVANMIKSKSFMFTSSGKPNLPSDAPKTDGSRLTYDKWLTLPTKERNQRYKEMRQNDK